MFGPLYLPIVATTSLSSAAGLGGDDHDSRWFEVHASRLGGKFFDRQYGEKAPGYYKNSPDHFDYNVYKNGGTTTYINPRTGYRTQGDGNPTTGARFSVWDIVVPLFSLSTGTPFIIF